tara:strand:- start:123 stop:242 length:120 start_codon:yes stop_codon:yes gene_type:complete
MKTSNSNSNKLSSGIVPEPTTKIFLIYIRFYDKKFIYNK